MRSISAEFEGVTGCGGFVKASPQLSKIMKDKTLDYSVITVKVVTSEGTVKSSTECAPTGYYFVPVYDKGNFFLQVQGPPGWAFEPSKVPIQIGEDNQCKSAGHQQEGGDIDFLFTGFTISGKVAGEKCEGVSGSKGPEGVTVTLFIKQDGKLTETKTTTSDSQGVYKFNNNAPGKYSLKATHSSWSLSKDSADIEVVWDNVQVKDPFLVTGYDVSGTIKSEDEKISGVDFLLYSKTVKSVDCPKVTIETPKDLGTALCSAKSDSEGKFVFKNIPCGEYTVVPYYRGLNTTFDVEPNSVQVSVSTGSVTLKESFQVLGFSVLGKVVDRNGKGLSDVKIHLNSKHKTTTDQQGVYKLDQFEVEHFKSKHLKNIISFPH